MTGFTRCIVHAGTHKTGTTTVQDVLAAHRASLAASGFAYPAIDRKVVIGPEGDSADDGIGRGGPATVTAFPLPVGATMFPFLEDVKPADGHRGRLRGRGTGRIREAESASEGCNLARDWLDRGGREWEGNQVLPSGPDTARRLVAGAFKSTQSAGALIQVAGGTSICRCTAYGGHAECQGNKAVDALQSPAGIEDPQRAGLRGPGGVRLDGGIVDLGLDQIDGIVGERRVTVVAESLAVDARSAAGAQKQTDNQSGDEHDDGQHHEKSHAFLDGIGEVSLRLIDRAWWRCRGSLEW